RACAPSRPEGARDRGGGGRSMEDGGMNDREERRRGSPGGCLAVLLVLGLLMGGAGAAVWYLGDSIRSRFTAPDPVTVASSSLQGLREQNRLTTLTGSYV